MSAVIAVVPVGAAGGSRAAAAALACAGSEPDRAGLLIELGATRPPRPSLFATAGARRLEERLAAHLPRAAVAARGTTCHLTPGEHDGLDLLAAALPLVRDSVGVVHLPPALLQPVVDEPRVGASGVMLRADLPADRPLTALTARDLVDRGIRVAVLKRPLGWLAARAALFGAAPPDATGLPPRLVASLVDPDDSKFRDCYDRKDGTQGDSDRFAPARPG